LVKYEREVVLTVVAVVTGVVKDGHAACSSLSQDAVDGLQGGNRGVILTAGPTVGNHGHPVTKHVVEHRHQR
jgi:hypothetical protein